MDAKLSDETRRHHRARNVREQPARIANHLEDARRVLTVHLILVESESGVAQRVVHVDEHLAIVLAVWSRDADATREVLRDVGAEVNVVLHLEQSERERLVRALEP